MIISASRRTDIPAFFAEEFIKSIEKGYLDCKNPFNRKQVRRISLLSKDIDAIVFWTKNPEPIFKHLKYLDEKGFRYYFQYTLNAYPKLFEPNLPSLEKRIDIFKELSKRIGAEKVIWRYDPIIISDATPITLHLEMISKLVPTLKTYTNRLVISFVDYYKKVTNKFLTLPIKQDTFIDIIQPRYEEILHNFAQNIKKITKSNNLDVFTCAEKVNLKQFGIFPGSCIDGELINRIFNLNQKFLKDKSQRIECGCIQSTDIGDYNTCKYGCTYCYANKSLKNNEEKGNKVSLFDN